MIIGNSDERGDWAKKFFNDEEFAEIVDRSDRFMAFEAEELTFQMPPFTVNQCMALIDKWEAALEGDDKELDFFYDMIDNFIAEIQVVLEDIGIIRMDDDDTDDFIIDFEDPEDEL